MMCLFIQLPFSLTFEQTHYDWVDNASGLMDTIPSI